MQRPVHFPPEKMKGAPRFGGTCAEHLRVLAPNIHAKQHARRRVGGQILGFCTTTFFAQVDPFQTFLDLSTVKDTHMTVLKTMASEND